MTRDIIMLDLREFHSFKWLHICDHFYDLAHYIQFSGGTERAQ